MPQTMRGRQPTVATSACTDLSASGSSAFAVFVACRGSSDQVGDGHRFVAVWAQAARGEAGAGLVAVLAPLLAEVAAVAFTALVDDVGASGRACRGRGGRFGCRAGVSGAPGGLPAGGGAVALAADRGERGLADRAGGGRGGVGVTDVVTRRAHRVPRGGGGGMLVGWVR